MGKKTGKNLPSEHQTEQYERIEPLLNSIFEETKEFSKKKPDGALNKLKVGMINKVLQQVKDFLSTEANIEFLELLDEETLPSYSDAVLMIGQFKAVMTQFRSKFYGYDDEDDESRWFTKERQKK